MSVVSSAKSEPLKMQLPNGQVKNVRIIFTTHKIETDNDAALLTEAFSQGAEIMSQIHTDKCDYIFIKKAEEIKLAL